ncbi:MAG TPA: Hsp20/alpha crystallin family protein, partial [Erysipelothrix sp.]|nr:Hsp20/alpha crystallin family protein [Erysipelothrix sp.]
TNFSYGSDIDIYREDSNYVVEADLPGFTKEDIDIQFKGDILSISASLNEEEEDTSNKNYFYRSRRSTHFEKQIRFKDVDGENINASYDNGVLKVTLPTKVNEEDMVKRISVE